MLVSCYCLYHRVGWFVAKKSRPGKFFGLNHPLYTRSSSHTLFLFKNIAKHTFFF